VKAYGANWSSDAECEEDTDSSANTRGGRVRRFRPFKAIRRAVMAGLVTTAIIIAKHK